MAIAAKQLSQAEREFQAAVRDAGVSREQLQHFLKGYYIPQPKQLTFHAACRSADASDGPTQIGFGGARGPGKSHALFAQIALDDCQRVPELKVLYIRKVAKNAKEQFEDLRRVVLRHVRHDYNKNGVVTFPNGSRIIIGHFRSESDVDQYLGLEYDIIVIEEATTLTLAKYKALRDSNRTSKPNFRPRIYASTNPGNIGHVWFKERFITPARMNDETDTRFVFATVDDNRFVDAGYTKKLEENTGWKLRAYRYGDWDIAAGQYFSTWRYDVHVIPAFTIPNHWPVWAALDYGYTHPTAVLFFTEFDGTVYIIGEHVQAKTLPRIHAEEIDRKLDRLGRPLAALDAFVAGADVFAQKGDAHAKTIAEQYAEYGIDLVPAAMDRVSGWSEILRLLGDPDRGIEPRLKIFDTCRSLIECLPALQHNPNKPEDVLKWDVDDEGNGGDDPADALRYGLMTRLLDQTEMPVIGGERKSFVPC